MPAGDLITQDGQMEWNGVLMGAGTPFRWTGLAGWNDLPPTRGSDDPRVGRHGSFPGQLLLDERTITYNWLTSGVSRSAFPAAIAALRRATALSDNPVEAPLVAQVDGLKLMCMARCTKRAIPTDKQYAVGYTAGALQWVASNPRLFELPQQTIPTGLASPAADGLTFPLVFPLVFGTGRSGGRLTVANNGDTDAWPMWEITAGTALKGPTITNLSGPGEIGFDPTWTLSAANGPLLVDTDQLSAVLTDSDTSAGPNLFTANWFPIPAGGSIDVAFTAANSDPGALLTCLAYHTYQ